MKWKSQNTELVTIKVLYIKICAVQLKHEDSP